MASLADSTAGVEIGEVLVGKYQIEGVIGRGGMGLVLRARHLELNHPVAIKLLRDDIRISEEERTRFTREAKAAIRLSSEHVARVTDVGLLPDGRRYMVMEYLEGQDLGQLIKEHGRLNPQLAVDLIIQACDGLAEAHSLGIVHRDVKPSNLFVTWRSDGTPLVKVLDFGISKSLDSADMSLTQTQSMLGTPAYMSPEQMRSARTVDPRTDIWSLGAVLYEALQGAMPFQADSFSEMCVKVAMDPPAPLSVVEFEPIIARCLAKDPAQRYPTIGDLAYDLVPFSRDPAQAAYYADHMARLSGRASGDHGMAQRRASTPVLRDSRPSLPSPPPSPDVVNAAPTISTARGPRRWPWVLLALATVGSGVAIGVALALRDDGSPAETTPGTHPSGGGDPTALTKPVEPNVAATPDGGANLAGGNAGTEHAGSDATAAEHGGSDATAAEHAGSDAATAEHAGSNAATAEHAGSNAATAEHAGDKPLHTPKGPKVPKTNGTGHGPAVDHQRLDGAATKPPEAKPPVGHTPETKPPPPPCDPYTSRKGC